MHHLPTFDLFMYFLATCTAMLCMAIVIDAHNDEEKARESLKYYSDESHFH